MIVIDHYYKQGVLSKMLGRWSAEDRLKVASEFYSYFRQAGLEIKAVDPSKIKVDTSYKNSNDIAMYPEDRFRKALRVLPEDTVDVIMDVVVFDRIIKGSYTRREKQKEKLLQGLDALCGWYYKRG